MELRANLALFRSRHALHAVLALAVLCASAVVLAPRLGIDPHAVRIQTGCAAALAMLIVLGYVLRKYMHKLGYSPEFRRRVPLAELEAFDARLNALRLDVLSGKVRGLAAVQERLPAVLRGVERVVRVEIEPAADECSLPRLLARPTEPLGRTSRWLHAHLYYGLLFAALVLLHGRLRFQAPVEVLLNSLALLLLATGLAGITLWAFGPTWLSRKERRHRLSIEQAYVFRRHYHSKLKAGMAALAPEARAAVREVWKARAAHDLADRARFALLTPSLADARIRDEAQGLLVLIAQYTSVRRALRELWRARLVFMVWRYVHVPCAILFLGAVLLHALSIWRY